MTEERDLSVPQLVFLKVETSGLYRNDLSREDPGQPFAMEIAGMLCNRAGAITNCFSHIIRPEGRVTQANALKIHGISDRVASQVGIAESRVIGVLSDLLRTPIVTGLKVVSYTEFDPNIISSLFARFAVAQGKGANVYDRLWAKRPLIEFVSLQTPWCTQACKLEMDGTTEDYRRPSLYEAAEIILGKTEHPKHHDAMTGMLYVRDLYFHFDRQGYFEVAA